jgi:hypothetical protein
MSKNESEVKSIEATQQLLVLGIPLGIYSITLAEIISAGAGPHIFLKIYGLFLGFYLLFIFLREYTIFGSLHALKSAPVDCLILSGMFFSIKMFISNGSDTRFCLLWLSLFLLSLTVWEIYTMIVGREEHFNAPLDSLSPLSMLKHLFRALGYKFGKEIDHWNEYRYWVMLDGLLFILVFTAFLLRTTINSNSLDVAIYWSILMAGFYLGGFNIYRYKLVKSAVVKRGM